MPSAEAILRIKKANRPIEMAPYQRFQSGRHAVADVARVMGCAASTLYKYIEGESILPAWALAPIYRATDDLERLLDTIQRHIETLRAKARRAAGEP